MFFNARFRARASYALLISNNLAVGIICGATLYAAVVIEPNWVRTASAVRAWWGAPIVLNGWSFLAVFGSFISLSSLFILRWGWLQKSLIRHWTIAYFIAISSLGALSLLYVQPLEIIIQQQYNSLPDRELMKIVGKWVFWNQCRVGVGIGCFFLLGQLFHLSSAASEKRTLTKTP